MCCGRSRPRAARSTSANVARRQRQDKIDVTTDLQAFGLIVTAEPYFSVTHPSDEVVAENIILQDTKGFEEPIDAKFDVLEGKEYTIDVPAEQLPSARRGPDVPLDLLEARNAVAIAKAAGAQQYAATSITKAEDMLQRAEDYYQRKQGRTPIGTAARGATQMAEDARVLTLRRKEQEREEAARRAQAGSAAPKRKPTPKPPRQREQAAKLNPHEDARKRAERKPTARRKRAGSAAASRPSSCPAGNCPEAQADAPARPRRRTGSGRKRFARKKRCAPACWRNSIRSCRRATRPRADRQHARRSVRFQQVHLETGGARTPGQEFRASCWPIPI